MPSEVFPITGRIMKNFLCEGNKGSEVNHLPKWEFGTLGKMGMGISA